MRPLLALAFVLAATAAAEAAPELVATETRTPVGDAVDIVILSEGFAASEKGEFVASARKVIAELENDDASMVKAARAHFNFHLVWQPSNAGASVKLGGAGNDSAFKMRRTATGMLDCDDAAAHVAAGAAAPDADLVVVLARFEEKLWELRANADVPPNGGIVRLPEDSFGAIVHELGHALYSLGDEYVEHETEIPEDAKSSAALFPNITLDPECRRFQPIVAPPYFEGAFQYAKGVWRARPDCRMRSSWSSEHVPFCTVCRAIMGELPKNPPAAPKIVAPRADAKVPAGSIASFAPAPGPAPVRYTISIQRLDGAKWTEIRQVSVESFVLTHVLSDLEVGKHYSFGVCASNLAGSSKWVFVDFDAAPAVAPPRPPRPAVPHVPPPSSGPAPVEGPAPGVHEACAGATDVGGCGGVPPPPPAVREDQPVRGLIEVVEDPERAPRWTTRLREWLRKQRPPE